jgi:hypothetical protein
MFMGAIWKASLRAYSTWNQQVATSKFGCYCLE